MSLRLAILLLLLPASLLNSQVISTEDSAAYRLQVRGELEKARVMADSVPREAVSIAHDALILALEKGDPACLAEAQLTVGELYHELDLYKESTPLLREAFDTFVLLQDSSKQAHTASLIGFSYFFIRSYDPAMHYYELVLDYGKSLKDTSLMISGLNSIASVYGNTNRYDSALVLLKEALILARTTNKMQEEIQAYYFMGDVHLYSGGRTQALKIFHDLEKYYDLETNHPRYLSSLYNSMTKAYLEKKQLGSAREYSNKSYAALQEQMGLRGYIQYYFFRYKLDSIGQNYQGALQNHMSYKALSDSLNDMEFREKLANQEIAMDLVRAEEELVYLETENKLKDREIIRRRTANISYIILSLLLLFAIVILIRGYIQIRDKNTRLNKQSKDLKDAQQKLVHSEKMASIGTLTAGIAHEINNPLNFISGGLGIIKEVQEELDWSEQEENKQKCNTASRMADDGLERAVNIVRSMMTFSHKGGTKPQEADLNEIIDNTLLFLRSKIGDQVKIVKQYQLRQKVQIYPEKMHQVIMNLVDNALHAISEQEKGEKLILIRTSAYESQLSLSIRNSGPLIPDENLPRLFDPFFTTHEPGAGTGLGLSICYTLIEEHGGEILVQNQENGVEFLIHIPL